MAHRREVAARALNGSASPFYRRGLIIGPVVIFLVAGLVPGLLSGPLGTAGPPHPAVAGPGAPSDGARGAAGVHFPVAGPIPSAWGHARMPPGWTALPTRSAPPSGSSWGSGTSGSGSSSNWNNRFCAGVWPGFSPLWRGNPQSLYASDCYGHDEPGIQFYSTLPGSGGNVSWNVTLPVDRSATLNQSNLYSAMWFGMTLTDPFAWMDQCFLELQFYPDQTWYNPGPLFPNITVNGAWIGAAVAWQIEAKTGAENPCFYEPLFLNGTPGPAFLNMSQGDQIHVKMTGWTGSTNGEQLVVTDLSNGERSNLTLFNATGHYPLNPSYVTNSFENGLQWTPGGEYPVVFSFETGHAGNTNWPSNNSFGGCSPGFATAANPAAPCPGYDPSSWANDTLSPWYIKTPTFFAGHTTSIPAQVGFTQDFGGISLISQLSGGTCNDRTGSAWCTYPWYSYSCRAHAFSFGATDYAGVSSDFGEYNEYATGLQANALGFGFYPPTNFSIPTCARPSFTVSVGTSGGAGSAYFLSQAVSGAANVTNVGAGDYSLNAIGTATSRFDHWSTTGNVTVGITSSAWTSLRVSGTGTVTAVFSAHPRTTVVTFGDVPRGRIGLDPAMTFRGPFTGTGDPIGTFVKGSTDALSAGIYSIQAYPPAGYNFSFWSVNNSGAAVASATFPYTWLVVTGERSSVSLVAWYTKSSSHARAELFVFGNGTASLDGLTVTHSGANYSVGLSHPRVGSYPLVATPGKGANSVLWLYGNSGLVTNFSMNTWINLEDGLTVVEAVFGTMAPVKFVTGPASGGAISFLTAPQGRPIPNGTTVTLAPGAYAIAADPFAGYAFTGWTVSGGASVANASGAVTALLVTDRATVTARFTSTSATTTLRLFASPVFGGSILFDGMTMLSSTVANKSVAPGLHWVSETSAPGWSFYNWSSSGTVLLVGPSTPMGQEINVTGSGRLAAGFVRAAFPITLTVFSPEGRVGSTANLTIGSVTLSNGETTLLRSGVYKATLSGIDDNVTRWTTGSNLTLSSTGTSTVYVRVVGSGTVYAILGDSDHDIGSGGGGNVAAPLPHPPRGIGAAVSGGPFVAELKGTRRS